MERNSLFKAFTLIELLVVVTIVLLIASSAFVVIGRFYQKARDERRKVDLQKIATALERYRADNGKYPVVSSCSQLESFLTPTYLSKFPQDPKGGQFSYECTTTDKTYTLKAKLELSSEDFVLQN